MSKLTIRNNAEQQWTSMLESRSRLGLGSIAAHSRRVEIELHQGLHGNRNFTCSLSIILISGEKHALVNTQPKADAAIDGVIARACRTVARRGLIRSGTENTLLTAAEVGSVQLQ